MHLRQARLNLGPVRLFPRRQFEQTAQRANERSEQRFDTHLASTFSSFGRTQRGVVTNLSRRGLFLATRDCRLFEIAKELFEGNG